MRCSCYSFIHSSPPPARGRVARPAAHDDRGRPGHVGDGKVLEAPRAGAFGPRGLLRGCGALPDSETPRPERVAENRRYAAARHSRPREVQGVRAERQRCGRADDVDRRIELPA